MKKFLLSTFALLGMSAVVSAQDNLIVNDVYAMPGQTVVATLNFSSPENVYKGMHIYLTFPEGFTMEASGAVSSDRDGDFIKYVVDGKEANFAIGNDQTFTTTSVNVEFTVGEDVAVSDKPYEIAVSGQFEASGVEDGPVSGKINVYVNDYITLDENSQVAPKASDGKVDLVLKRTLKANEWSTICVPFALNSTALKAAFGDATYELGQLAGYEVEYDENDKDKITGLNVSFTKVAGAKANTPLIIKVSKDFDVTSVINAQISPASTKFAVTVFDEDTFEEVETCSMTGTYVAQTVVPANSLFLSDNQFWYSTGLTKMKGLRAYFTFNDVLTSVKDAGSRIKFSLSDGDTQTEIQIPELMPMDGEYYDLKGQRVETPSKGIYIKDGKKVVVK